MLMTERIGPLSEIIGMGLRSLIFLTVWGVLAHVPPVLPVSGSCPADSFLAAASAGETSGEEDPVELDKDWDPASETAVQDTGKASDESETASKDGPAFTWRLETAFENYINTRRELHFDEAYKKNEISARLEATYGAENNYLFSTTDLFFFPTFINDTIGDDYVYAADSETHRNLRITSESSEVIFRELYYNWKTEKCRVRIGNQIYGWGTADFMNSTAYFNPTDYRELMFKDQDRIRMGVPSLSGMLFFDGFTAETVFVPVHTAAVLPVTNNFWAVKQVEDAYPLIFGESDPMDANSKNFAYGERIAGTFYGMDMSVSGYHGPDREPLLLPYGTVMVENQPVSVLLQPVYEIVDYIGADLAWPYEDFVFQAEAAYSPNKNGFVLQNTDMLQDLTFPYDTRKSDYVSYSLGMNYFIPLQKLIPGHAGESLLTLEWFQAHYFDDDLDRPRISDFLTCRFQDAYFDDHVKVSMTGIFETYRGGIIWWPKIGYDFQNGFEAELGYVGINGHGEGDYEEDSLFYYYKDNDLIMVTIRYAYP
ncbi:MAG: hypothetical protein C4518_08240 [Desulfobacteraceae bacterium]|nr:MAG: hypothetical protein C4518_08240 [Desulfobacteraceae bacterium]